MCYNIRCSHELAHNAKRREKGFIVTQTLTQQNAAVVGRCNHNDVGFLDAMFDDDGGDDDDANDDDGLACC